MKGTTLATLVVTALLAGCLGGDDEGPTTETGARDDDALAAPRTVTVSGLVQDDGFAPLAGALVTVEETGANVTTDAAGRFLLPSMPVAGYRISAAYPGHENTTLLVSPREGPIELAFTLPFIPVPYSESTRFRGHLDCASETLIITGSCDLIIQFANEQATGSPDGPIPQPFSGNNSFDHAVGPGWKSLVADLSFDPSAAPGLDGMRLSALASRSASELTLYDKYEDAHAAEPFTLRLDAGTETSEGLMLPTNATQFRFEVYPHGYGYHQACDPSGDTCFLGIGAAGNLEFDLFVTTFYLEAAPAGWSLL
ncbi:MAG: carboxypeptidase-like regulatory domain-containing protein [Thermoplasmatota archaeon]